MTKADPVVLAPYDETWPHIFETEACTLRQVLTPYSLQQIEHVGSTAIRDIIAKPTIDMMAGVRDITALPGRHDALWRSLGYEWGHADDEADDWHYFIKRDDSGRRLIHLHIVPHGGQFWVDTLAFRDALRSNPSLARKYAELKIQLASQFPHDRLAYLAGKTEFVSAVLSETKTPFRRRAFLSAHE